MTSKKALQGEQQFFADIRDLLRVGRETAYRSVNTVMVKTYSGLLSKSRAVRNEQIMVSSLL